MTVNTKPLDRVLTTEELAEVIGVTPDTLKQWRASEEDFGPPYVKLNRMVRYRWSDVNAWLTENLQATA